MDTPDHGTWSHIVHALLRRYFTYDVLRQAQDSVTITEQSECEDKTKFPERVSKAARLCRHVFSKEGLVNHYVQGLRPDVHKLVAQQVRRMMLDESVSLSDVRQAAAAIGISQRALFKEGEKVTKSGGKPSIDGKEKGARLGPNRFY